MNPKHLLAALAIGLGVSSSFAVDTESSSQLSKAQTAASEQTGNGDAAVAGTSAPSSLSSASPLTREREQAEGEDAMHRHPFNSDYVD